MATELKARRGDLLVFTDGGGKLLVGNEDFSYTLNKTGRFLKI